MDDVFFKVKSLVPEYTNKDMEDVSAVKFLSFESAIRMFREQYKIEYEVAGYRVTKDGIEIIVKP